MGNKEKLGNKMENSLKHMNTQVHTHTITHTHTHMYVKIETPFFIISQYLSAFNLFKPSYATNWTLETYHFCPGKKKDRTYFYA